MNISVCVCVCAHLYILFLFFLYLFILLFLLFPYYLSQVLKKICFVQMFVKVLEKKK